jgi:hypothetical protein
LLSFSRNWIARDMDDERRDKMDGWMGERDVWMPCPFPSPFAILLQVASRGRLGTKAEHEVRILCNGVESSICRETRPSMGQLLVPNLSLSHQQYARVGY